MGQKNRVVLRELAGLPNIGPRMARDLLRLGVRSKEDLKRWTGKGLYEAICRLDGVRHDPCVLDTFEAVTVFAKGGPDLPWWHYSRVRKRRGAAKG